MHPAHCAFRAPARKVRVSGRVPLKVRPCTQRNRRGPAPTLTGLIVRCRRNVKGPRATRILRAQAKHPAYRCSSFTFCFSLSLFASARRSALLLGPHCIAAAAAAMPAGAARWIAPIPPLAHGCAIGGTQAEAAYFSGRSPKSAMPGVHFFWLLFFVQAKKSDPLAAGEG